MVKKDDYILVKTQADFEKNIEVFKNALFEGRKLKIALAPDFDAGIIWTKNFAQFDRFYANYVYRLIEGTAEIYTKEKQADVFNKIVDEVRNAWWRQSTAYSQYVLLKDVLKKGDNSAVLFIQAYQYGDRSSKSLIRDKKDTNKFSKYVTPDNQVVLNQMEGYFSWLKYNFSGLPFSNNFMSLIEGLLPKEKDLSKMSESDRMLVEKYYREFKGTRLVDVKKLFPGAKDPQGLDDLRRGIIPAWRVFFENLDREDFKFIRPAWDLANLDAHNLYELMSMPGLRWNAAQVRAIMNMIIDKADASYFDEIIKVINTNKHIFLTQTEDNLKLWRKIEDKFADQIERSREYATGVKKSLEQARVDLQNSNESLSDLRYKSGYLDDELWFVRSISGRAGELKSKPDNNRFFAKHALVVLDALRDFELDGTVQQIAIPDKPWKLFAFDNEKKLYAELVDIIVSYNEKIKNFMDNRIKIFGEYKFGRAFKKQLLESKIKDFTVQANKAGSTLRTYQGFDEKTAPGFIAQENIDAQKAAKQKRFDAAKKKMQEKSIEGFVPGKKSGAVRADEIAKQTRINNKVAQLRTKKEMADMSDEQLQAIAANMLFGKKR